jgi:hypothetical protein
MVGHPAIGKIATIATAETLFQLSPILTYLPKKNFYEQFSWMVDASTAQRLVILANFQSLAVKKSP